AQEIGKSWSKFVHEELQMKYISYDNTEAGAERTVKQFVAAVNKLQEKNNTVVVPNGIQQQLVEPMSVRGNNHVGQNCISIS
ncbi:hypothetical protein A4A49_44595, partial [Nicotiana attenuata]